MKRVPTFTGPALGAIGLAVVGALSIPGIAWAAGSGYTPPPPTPGGTSTGLPGTVVTSSTIQPSGGTASGAIGNATVTVTVPAGAFPNPVQVVVTDAHSASVTISNGHVVLTLGLGFYVNGTKVTGTFPAVTVVVNSPDITAGSTIYTVNGTNLVPLTGATVTNGSVTFTVTSDPTFEVTAPTSSPAIPGAASPTTGKPFLLEGLVAAGLLSFGALLFLGLRLGRRFN